MPGAARPAAPALQGFPTRPLLSCPESRPPLLLLPSLWAVCASRASTHVRVLTADLPEPATGPGPDQAFGTGHGKEKGRALLCPFFVRCLAVAQLSLNFPSLKWGRSTQAWCPTWSCWEDLPQLVRLLFLGPGRWGVVGAHHPVAPPCLPSVPPGWHWAPLPCPGCTGRHDRHPGGAAGRRAGDLSLGSCEDTWASQLALPPLPPHSHPLAPASLLGGCPQWSWGVYREADTGVG